MPALVIVGAQWGDEGKGKITDYLAAQADGVVRYQGGNNAGHTVVVGEDVYKLHLVPSGILYPETACMLGNGVVVDLPGLVGELTGLRERGIDTSKLLISEAAHCILPYHRVLDRVEETRKGADRIGTTHRGVGPAYRDKVNRIGIRVCDIGHPEVLDAKLEANRKHKAELLAADGGEDVDWSAVRAELREAYAAVEGQVGDTSSLVNRLLDADKKVLFEGAQGTFLDLDHGTYPYVTSSTPTAGGACVGAGVGPTRITGVMGVAKAYTTRVGMGPFPTELQGPLGDRLADVGHEFGTTTGRRRRCGWLDAVMLRYACRINGLTSLALTKLDVLDGFEEIRVCVAYDIDGERCEDFPTDPARLERAEPVYETLPGWQQPIADARSLDALPDAAVAYLDFVAEQTSVPVKMVSVGAARATTIATDDVWSG